MIDDMLGGFLNERNRVAALILEAKTPFAARELAEAVLLGKDLDAIAAPTPTGNESVRKLRALIESRFSTGFVRSELAATVVSSGLMPRSSVYRAMRILRDADVIVFEDGLWKLV